MRLAYLGPLGAGGGVPLLGTQIVTALAAQGVEVDVYGFLGAGEDIPKIVAAAPGVQTFMERSRWRWGRFYSGGRVSSFLTGLFVRILAYRRLVRQLMANHRIKPYDVVYQFSQTETPFLETRRRDLPPVVVHPEVHAAGELTWHRAEAGLGRRCEGVVRHYVVRAVLIVRSGMQRRRISRNDLVIAPSEEFRRLLIADYGIAPTKVFVVPNMIDLDRFRPNPDLRPLAADAVSLLFISRLAVRKGVEMITELSQRLVDLDGHVEIQVLGDRSLLSDYRPLLDDASMIVRYRGHLPPDEVATCLSRSSAILVPSHYEPFGLVAAEALGCGVPVIASEAVGATENVASAAVMHFRAGDLDGLERQVRTLISEVESDLWDRRPAACRSEAERLFSPQVVARRLIEVLELAMGAKQ